MSHIYMSHVTYQTSQEQALKQSRRRYKFSFCDPVKHTMIAGNTPLGGGFYLAGSLTKNQEIEDPPRRICTRCFEGGPLPSGSWLGKLPNRKPS